MIERNQLILHISGHLQKAHLSLIEEILAKETHPVIFDLAEVTLVDQEAVRFLVVCNVRSIGLRNCPAFIREWMGKV
jgi:anti-anti-sigma regulatory factor